MVPPIFSTEESSGPVILTTNPLLHGRRAAPLPSLHPPLIRSGLNRRLVKVAITQASTVLVEVTVYASSRTDGRNYDVVVLKIFARINVCWE